MSGKFVVENPSSSTSAVECKIAIKFEAMAAVCAMEKMDLRDRQSTGNHLNICLILCS